jgi:3'(2'), 5'-bisphosphate nucleotidase
LWLQDAKLFETILGLRVQMSNAKVTPRDLGHEAMLAMQAVTEALRVARIVEHEAAGGALTKDDDSPVTVADFSVQALIARRLGRDFPNDNLVAEEDASALRAIGSVGVLARVVDLVRHVDGSSAPDGILEWIDRGGGSPGKRFWTLDPIDGTKGLLRGGQYVVALALIVDGVVQVGVLGCPHLLPGEGAVRHGSGGMAVAVRGLGAWWSPLADNSLQRLFVSRVDDPGRMRVLHSFEASHGDVGRLSRAISALGTRVPTIPMDSQAKHVVIASGGADVLLRFPSDKGRHDAIWDQAAGSLLIEEAGGRVTDLRGRTFDFSAGRHLLYNEGLIASNGVLHDAVLAAVRRSESATARATPAWEHFSHEADIGLVGMGPTKAEAFRQAAIALTAVVTDPANVRLTTPVTLGCRAPNDELLLFEWLNALIYEMAVRSMLFGDFTVEIDDGELHATARGEHVDLDRHEPAVEVKGATMTALEVVPAAGGWRAQCVVDV